MRNSYDHSQRGPLALIFYSVAAVMLVSAWLGRNDDATLAFCAALAALMVLVALMFTSLRVRDEFDVLDVRFGPLPILGTRVAYRDIKAVARGKSTLIDGWGIHWTPGKGWIFNLWGFDCVEIKLKNKTFRVGTDDPDNLVQFLQSKIDADPGHNG